MIMAGAKYKDKKIRKGIEKKQYGTEHGTKHRTDS